MLASFPNRSVYRLSNLDNWLVYFNKATWFTQKWIFYHCWSTITVSKIEESKNEQVATTCKTSGKRWKRVVIECGHATMSRNGWCSCQLSCLWAVSEVCVPWSMWNFFALISVSFCPVVNVFLLYNAHFSSLLICKSQMIWGGRGGLKSTTFTHTHTHTHDPRPTTHET